MCRNADRIEAGGATARGPHNEPRLEADRPPLAVRLGDALDQQRGGLAANFLAWLGDHGQARLEIVRPFEIIESGQRHVVWHAQAEFAQRVHDADRRQVVAGGDRGRRFRQFEQFAGRRRGCLGARIRGDQERFVIRDAARLEGGLVSLGALARRGEAGRSRDEGDPFVTVRRQMLDQELHRALVLDADLIEPRRRQAIDQNERDAIFVEILDRAAFRIGGRREDDAVDAALMQRLHDLQLPRGFILGVGEKHHQAEPRAFGLDRADNVREVGVRDHRNRDADAVGRRPLERAGQSVRAKADEGDRLLDELGGVGVHPPRAVDHMRDGGDGNASPARDVNDGRHRRRAEGPTQGRTRRIASDVSPVRRPDAHGRAWS